MRIPRDPQFHRRSKAQVKSGPDVFADALVRSRHRCCLALPFFYTSPIVLTALGTRRGFLRESAAIPGFGHTGHAVLPLCANGYRLAKCQGKPNPANIRKPARNMGLRDFAVVRAAQAFTCDSSRYLNCPSNLIGHDDPNKPANGVGNNGTFQTTGQGPRAGRARQKIKKGRP